MKNKGSKRVSGLQMNIRKMTEAIASKKQNREKSDSQQVIDFSIGEPGFSPPLHVRQAGAMAYLDGPHNYSPVAGIPELRSAIAERESIVKGVDIASGDVLVNSGGAHALHNIIYGMLEQGDRVIVDDPCWSVYNSMLKSHDVIPVPISLIDVDGVNETAIYDAINGGAKAIVINSPRNPDGFVIKADYLKAIAQIAQDKDILIISDDVYDEIYFDEKPTSIMKYAPDNTIGVGSFSKAYAMTGWRLGYTLSIDKEIIDTLKKATRVTTSCPQTAAQCAGIAALNGPQEFLNDARKEYKGRRDIAVESLANMGLDAEVPGGTFYILPKISDNIDDTSWEFALGLLKKEGVGVVPGIPFGSKGKNKIRISYGATNREQIKEGLDRIANYINTL